MTRTLTPSMTSCTVLIAALVWVVVPIEPRPAAAQSAEDSAKLAEHYLAQVEAAARQLTRRQLQHEMGEAEARVEDLEAEMVRRQGDLAKLRHQARETEQVILHAGLTPGSVEPVLQSLTVRQLEHELTLHGKVARIKAIERLIKELAAGKPQVSKAQRAVIQQAEVQLAAHRARLQRIEAAAERGTVAAHELRQAEFDMKQAELELEARKAEVEQGSSHDAIQLYTRQLRDLTIDVTELRARQEFVKDRLRAYSKLPGAVRTLKRLTQDELPAVHREVAQLQRQLEATSEHLHRLRNELRQQSDGAGEEADAPGDEIDGDGPAGEDEGTAPAEEDGDRDPARDGDAPRP